MKAREICLLTLATCLATVGLSGAAEPRETSDRKPPISQGLKCDILFDALPNTTAQHSRLGFAYVLYPQ